MSIYADRYLLGIARLSIWLSIVRNLWNSWTLIHSSCFILGTNVPLNLSFESKRTHKLSEVDTFFLKLGSYSRHPVHSAFQRGIRQLFLGQVPSATSNSEGSGGLPQKRGTFDLDDFFTDIHSFFRLSSARREDYTSQESVTGVVAEYAKKHSETRRVSMKYAAVIYCMSNLLYDCQTYCQTYCKNVKSCMIEVGTKAKTMLRT